MTEQPSTLVTHFRNCNFKHKIKRLQIPQKLVYKKSYLYGQILHTRIFRREFVKNLPPEKRKGNM